MPSSFRADELKAVGLRVDVDDRNEKIGRKIREAQLQKVPFMLVTGDKEIEGETVAVRNRKDGDQGPQTIPDFIESVEALVGERALRP